ncbi:hypothetical protein N8603_03005 [Verrucomicrobiales bacterium]|nr:hypothetical protein [Verrucomicrobiales bacterium]
MKRKKTSYYIGTADHFKAIKRDLDWAYTSSLSVKERSRYVIKKLEELDSAICQ